MVQFMQFHLSVLQSTINIVNMVCSSLYFAINILSVE